MRALAFKWDAAPVNWAVVVGATLVGARVELPGAPVMYEAWMVDVEFARLAVREPERVMVLTLVMVEVT